MEDRDTGAKAPEAGVSNEFSAPRAPQAPPAGRQPNRPMAASHHGTARVAETLKPKSKKRRKRKRGRKVFARTDGEASATGPGTSTAKPIELPVAAISVAKAEIRAATIPAARATVQASLLSRDPPSSSRLTSRINCSLMSM